MIVEPLCVKFKLSVLQLIMIKQTEETFQC